MLHCQRHSLQAAGWVAYAAPGRPWHRGQTPASEYQHAAPRAAPTSGLSCPTLARDGDSGDALLARALQDNCTLHMQHCLSTARASMVHAWGCKCLAGCMCGNLQIGDDDPHRGSERACTGSEGAGDVCSTQQQGSVHQRRSHRRSAAARCRAWSPARRCECHARRASGRACTAAALSL